MRVGIETLNHKYMFIEEEGGARRRYFVLDDIKNNPKCFVDAMNYRLKKYENQIQDLQEQLKNVIPKFKNKQFIYALFTNTDFFRGQIESYDYYTKSYLIFFDDNIGSEWIPEALCFKTKAEAEKKLKELQGESK